MYIRLLLRMRKFLFQHALTFVVFAQFWLQLILNIVLIFGPRSCHGVASTTWAPTYGIWDVWLLFWTCAGPTVIDIIFSYHKELRLVKALIWCKGLHRVRRLNRPVTRSEIVYWLFLLVDTSVAVPWGGRCLHRILRICHIVLVTLLVNDAVKFASLVQDGFAVRLGTQFDAKDVLTFLQIYIILDLFVQLMQSPSNQVGWWLLSEYGLLWVLLKYERQIWIILRSLTVLTISKSARSFAWVGNHVLTLQNIVQLDAFTTFGDAYPLFFRSLIALSLSREGMVSGSAWELPRPRPVHGWGIKLQEISVLVLFVLAVVATPFAFWCCLFIEALQTLLWLIIVVIIRVHAWIEITGVMHSIWWFCCGNSIEDRWWFVSIVIESFGLLDSLSLMNRRNRAKINLLRTDWVIISITIRFA